MPNISERQIGAGFDILDKAVQDRTHSLLARDWIYRQDFDHWKTDYNQLASYARTYGGTEYVARQWRAEQPRYAWVPDALAQKIRVADPSNYDTRISVSGASGGAGGGLGGGGCGCGDKLSNTPVNYGGGPTSYLPPRAGTQIFTGGGDGGFPSLGDMFRDLLGYKPIPSIDAPYPDSQLIQEGNILSGIVTALIVGGILWGVHYAYRKAT